MTTAEQSYRELAGPGPADVLVYFTNDWTRESLSNVGPLAHNHLIEVLMGR